jgi:hypothetical protein
VVLQWLDEFGRHDGAAILAALAMADQQFATLQVQVLDA